MEPRGQELIRRYKLKFELADNAEITEQMCLEHWNLEKKLTTQLWESTPENRSIVFKNCYDQLYSHLEWLYVRKQYNPSFCAAKYKNWVAAIGEPPQRIYEVGSGYADLIQYLAEIGHTCKATDISIAGCREPGQQSCSNLCWGSTDGVHLDVFEPRDNYDRILSRQVIEHFHPDDIKTHFETAAKILVQGGLYIVSTPHRYTGPHDVSEVFGSDRPQGVHLKEYTYSELLKILLDAGFTSFYYIVPQRLRKLAARFRITDEEHIEKLGVIYLRIIVTAEKILAGIPNLGLRRSLSQVLSKVQIFKDHIFLAARK